LRKKILSIWLVLLAVCVLTLSLPLQASAGGGTGTMTPFNAWCNNGALNTSPYSDWGKWTWTYAQPPTTKWTDGNYYPTFNSTYHRIYVFGDYPDNDKDSTDQQASPYGSYSGYEFNIGYYDGKNNLISTKYFNPSNYGVNADDIDPCNLPTVGGSSDPEFPWYWVIGGNYTDSNPYEGSHVKYPQVSYLLNTDRSAAPGLWHAAVIEGDDTLPSTYSTSAMGDGGDHLYLQTCAFIVQASAIPEFPTAAAALAVPALCAGIYCWLRKKQVASVHA
jgi:hypothetical protein